MPGCKGESPWLGSPEFRLATQKQDLNQVRGELGRDAALSAMKATCSEDVLQGKLNLPSRSGLSKHAGTGAVETPKAPRGTHEVRVVG